MSQPLVICSLNSGGCEPPPTPHPQVHRPPLVSNGPPGQCYCTTASCTPSSITCCSSSSASCSTCSSA
ncbi:hypothetical protein A2U01_0098454, partial [Trifolium medium]|nr:hypothetical protein [Trifolium medium]